MWCVQGFTRSAQARALAIVALVGALGVAGAQDARACFACNSAPGDFTVLGIIAWQMQALHAALTSQMGAAQAGLAAGEINVALLSMTGLGFLYGGLHALGPGHGKIALGAHAAASGAPWSHYAIASFVASFGHVLSASLAVALVLVIFNGVLSDAQTMQRILTGVAGLGLAVVGFVVLRTGEVLHVGAHHDHGHSHKAPHATDMPDAGLMTVALAAALVPCTSSMLVLLYGAAHGAVWLAGLVVLFIALGQAFVQTGVAIAGGGVRGVLLASFGPKVLRIVGLSAGFAILAVGLAAMHAAIT